MPRQLLGAPPGVASPGGPYSMAAKAALTGDILFISGQVALDATGDLVGPGDIRGQTEQTFANLFAVLESAGGTFEDVVKLTIFLKDLSHLPVVSDVRRELYGDMGDPATSTVQANLASEGMLIEVEATAVLAS